MTAYEPTSTLTVYGGNIIYASDLNEVVKRLPRAYTKTSATARNTTTTLANDPELASIALEVGTYDIELIMLFTLTTTTTQKIKTRWGFTGTISDTIRLCHGPGSAQVAGPQDVTETTVRGYALTSQDAIYDVSTSTAYSAVLEKANGVSVTVAGNLSLQWAQNASSANNTTVQPNSAFRISRVG